MANNRDSYQHPDGYSVPRVTSIVGQLDKPALTYWAAGCAVDYITQNLPTMSLPAKQYLGELLSLCENARKEFRKVSKVAADIGTQVHEAVKIYLDTEIEPHPNDDRVIAGFLAFLEWKDQHHLEVLRTEQTLYGVGYAGTTDLIALVDSVPYLLDFKTSKQPRDNKPYYEWRLQLAAYREAWNDGLSIPDLDLFVANTGIIRLDKETGFPDFYDTSDTFEQDLEAFYALTVHWWIANAHQKKFISYQPKEVGMRRVLADLMEVHKNKEINNGEPGKCTDGAGKGKAIRSRRTRSSVSPPKARSSKRTV